MQNTENMEINFVVFFLHMFFGFVYLLIFFLIHFALRSLFRMPIRKREISCSCWFKFKTPWWVRRWRRVSRCKCPLNGNFEFEAFDAETFSFSIINMEFHMRSLIGGNILFVSFWWMDIKWLNKWISTLNMACLWFPIDFCFPNSVWSRIDIELGYKITLFRQTTCCRRECTASMNIK